jgi:hypothetical protein
VGGGTPNRTDGATRFVRDEVDLGVWKALATIKGGENPAEF